MKTLPGGDPRRTIFLLAMQILGLAALHVATRQRRAAALARGQAAARLTQIAQDTRADPVPDIVRPQPTPPTQPLVRQPVTRRRAVRTPVVRFPVVTPPPDPGARRSVSWGTWTLYLLARLFFVALTVIILEIAATTQVRAYLYFSIVPTVLALLIPYRKPDQRKDPDNTAGIVTTCAVALAIAIWPYYFYASATAPRTPAAIITTETFSLDPSTDTSAGCIGLIDDQQHHWLIVTSVLSSVSDNKIVLYQTRFGWTPDSQPTQSPTPLFDTPHLDQIGYALTPETVDATTCQISNPSRYGG